MSIEVRVPELAESVVEATVGNWLKQPGDAVEVGETLVELETDKVNLEVSAEQAGVLTSIAAEEGADVQVGDVLAVIDPSGAAAPSPQAEPAAATSAPMSTEASASSSEKATPVAQRMAADHGVNLAEVQHSGNRITKEDVEKHVSGQKPAAAPPPTKPTSPSKPAAAPTPSAAPSDRERRVRMSRRRQTIAKRLVEAQQTAAMLTTFNEIDMSAVMDLRKRRKDGFVEKHGVKLGFMSFFVKASVAALKAFPPVNASIDGNEIVYKDYYDIGMAVGAEEGLVVPILRDADRMSFAGIEGKVGELAQKARQGSLSLADLQGGTFTITNGGVFGSMLSTPILNPPQVGILGLHKIEQRPIALNGEVVIRPMMYVALSYDHRIIDGSEAVRFLVRIKELIEDPEALLLAG